jgi:hypothetical protein
MKDYLTFEGARNRKYNELYAALIRKAYGVGARCEVMIGHHLSFELDSKLETENEIPAADTLIFDHTIMTAAFGSMAVQIMQELASLPAEEREDTLRVHMTHYEVRYAPT